MARDDTQWSREPALAPFDPASLFPNAALHRVCGKLLLAQLSDRTGLFLLTGKAGTGKSALLAKIEAQSPAVDCCVGLPGRPDLTSQALVDLWSARLGLPGEAGDEQVRLDALGECLAAVLDRGAASALLLDDAHSVPNEVLETLRKISQWRRNGRKLVRIILAGRPDLARRLDRPDLSQVKRAIAFHAELGPLEETEVAAYITHRLNAAGYGGAELFSADALAAIARASAGVPRWINVHCRAAVLIAKRRSGRSVSLEVAQLAARDCAAFPRQPAGDEAPRNAGAEAVAPQTCLGQNWPWSPAGEAIADETAVMLRPLAPASKAGPRSSRRIETIARAAAAGLAGLAILAAVALSYTEVFGPSGPPALGALAGLDDPSPPLQMATEDAAPRRPLVGTAGPRAASLGRPDFPAGVPAAATGDAAALAPDPAGAAEPQTTSDPTEADAEGEGAIPSAHSTGGGSGRHPDPLAGMAEVAAGEVGANAPPLLGEPARGRRGWPVALQIVTARGVSPGTAPDGASKDAGLIGSVIDEAEAIVFAPLAWRLQDDTLATAADGAGSPPVQATQTWSGPAVEQLMARGDALLALGDIAAARLFYESAARGGSAAAAARVGMTYDPLYLERRGVLGAAANAQRAVEWYQEAVDRGHARAVVRLDGLTAYLEGAASRSAGPTAAGPSRDRQATSGMVEVEPATARSRQAAPRQGALGATAGEALRIQLAALKSQDAAAQEGLRLRALHWELLGGKDLAVERLDLSGGRGRMFGVQIGPFPDRLSAQDACARLKAKKQACFVVGPN